MSENSIRDHGISLTPLRPAVLTFTVDERGLEYVREMIAVMQRRYGMTYEQALEDLNARLGENDRRAGAAIVNDSWWWHETPEHEVRVMHEGGYWYREQTVR